MKTQTAFAISIFFLFLWWGRFTTGSQQFIEMGVVGTTDLRVEERFGESLKFAMFNHEKQEIIHKPMALLGWFVILFSIVFAYPIIIIRRTEFLITNFPSAVAKTFTGAASCVLAFNLILCSFPPLIGFIGLLSFAMTPMMLPPMNYSIYDASLLAYWAGLIWLLNENKPQSTRRANLNILGYSMMGGLLSWDMAAALFFVFAVSKFLPGNNKTDLPRKLIFAGSGAVTIWVLTYLLSMLNRDGSPSIKEIFFYGNATFSLRILISTFLKYLFAARIGVIGGFIGGLVYLIGRRKNWIKKEFASNNIFHTATICLAAYTVIAILRVSYVDVGTYWKQESILFSYLLTWWTLSGAVTLANRLNQNPEKSARPNTRWGEVFNFRELISSKE